MYCNMPAADHTSWAPDDAPQVNWCLLHIADAVQTTDCRNVCPSLLVDLSIFAADNVQQMKPMEREWPLMRS